MKKSPFALLIASSVLLPLGVSAPGGHKHLEVPARHTETHQARRGSTVPLRPSRPTGGPAKRRRGHRHSSGRPRAPGEVFPDHLLRLDDLTLSQVEYLLDLAAWVKQNPGGLSRKRFRNHSIVGLFEKPSSRTLVSSSAAAGLLGMRFIKLSSDETQMSRGETVADTARTLSLYARAIVARMNHHAGPAGIEELARRASVPVINALTDDHHPMQALTDLLTMREHFGHLKGLRVAFIGPAESNTAYSLIHMAALTGMRLVIAAPKGYQPRADILGPARESALARGGSIEVVEDPRKAVAGNDRSGRWETDVVYPEVWVPMGKAEESQERLEALRPYQVDQKLMSLSKRAILMHCLPAFRGQEVTKRVLDGPRSHVWRQAANRLPVAEAVLYTMLRAHEQKSSPR